MTTPTAAALSAPAETDASDEVFAQLVASNVERLTPATLAKAFRGELVPQDPNDEPTNVLLERLRGLDGADAKPVRKRKAAGK